MLRFNNKAMRNSVAIKQFKDANSGTLSNMGYYPLAWYLNGKIDFHPSLKDNYKLAILK